MTWMLSLLYLKIFVKRKNNEHRVCLGLGCGKEVLERRAFDLEELQHIDKELVPAATEDEIMVTDRNANKDGT
jgi:hypothetical protein